MWRIDQAARLVGQRADDLSSRQLDWLPPDGGWSLRRVLHHLAAAEWLYATALEDLLRGDGVDRYREAAQRFRDQISASASNACRSSPVYVHPNGELYTRERAIQEAGDAKGKLLKAQV